MSQFIQTFCFSAIALLSMIGPANAEVYECNGKWTNKPCDGKISKSIEEVGSNAVVDDATKQLRQKTSLLHEIRMKALHARDDLSLNFDIASLEKYCLDAATPVADCQTKIKSTDEELEGRISAASLVAAKKREVELQEEANEIQKERNRIEEENARVTIIEQKRVIIVPRDRYPHSQSHSSIGGSVSLGGGNVHVGVGAQAGETISNHGGSVIVLPRDRPAIPANNGVVVYDKFGTGRKIDGVKPGPFAR